MTSGELRDKIQPHDEDAEKAVLGAILLGGDIDSVSEVLRFIKADDFYKIAHRKIFEAILNLSNRSASVDLITLTTELKTLGELERAGGAGYISSLTTVVPSAANITFYAEIVRETSVRRHLLRIATEISADAYNDKNNSRAIIEEAEKKIFELADNQQTGSYFSAGSIVNQAVDSIENAFHNQGDYRGVPSGFMDLDALLSGFQKSEFVIIGARPSVGKTALALCMAAHISGISKARKDKAVGFFSLEMSRMAIMQRLVSSEGRISSIAIRTGNLKTADFNNLTKAAGRIYEAPLFLSDTPNMKILDLRSQARRMRSKENAEIIFIDYLGLIQSERPELPRWEQISEISRSMKALARELDIPIVALAQVGRQTDKKETPDLVDLRDSGSIEQDADVVMFLYRDKEQKGAQDSGTPNNIEEIHLKVAKNRNGPTGSVKLTFLRNYARFESSTGKSLE